jgi:dipeptidyl-peptidase-4
MTLLAMAAPLAAQTVDLSNETIWGSNAFASDLVAITWAPDGEHFTHVRQTAGGTDLVRVNARTGRDEVLVRGFDLVPPGSRAPIAIEGYTFSDDRTKLLIFANSVRVWRQNTKGEYFVWDLNRRRLTPASVQPGLQMFAKLSPDGSHVAFVRDNDIFVTDLATGAERALTDDGSENIINGTSDWVYEEELGLRDAFRWSPDGTSIAYWRFDQSAIDTFYMIDETELYPELIPLRYPKAGSVNSTVRIGVVDVTDGSTRWVDIGSNPDIYIADMDFVDDGEIWLTRLNRHQNKLEILLAEVATGASRVILTDVDEAWVEANVPNWVRGGTQFVLPSERDGFNHLYLFDRSGALIRQLTSGQWDVTAFHGIDDVRDAAYVTTTKDGPLGRTVYRVALEDGVLERLTSTEGTHRVQFSPTFSMFVDTHSRSGVPPVQTLHDADGKVVRTIADNADLAEKVTSLMLRKPEFMTVQGADGSALNAWIVKPRDFDQSRRYPVLMYVYGGPGSQTVTDAWGGARYLWHQYMAQEGYLVVSVDNRGTGARGRDFKKQTYLHLGRLESDDQIAAARYLATIPYVDGDRIGIWGWSYGGYMSSLSLFRGGDVFKAAIAVAPVTDWRLYDTIYTERFMRTPQENPNGYRFGSPVSHAADLRGNFLVIHGTGDDNVHAQNTTQLVQALVEADKQFDLRLYPNKTHSIAGGRTRVNLYEYMTAWLEENLK